jgi:D-alanine-D-alanine ligase
VRRLRVGVIYGGRSGEHEVSLASAASVFAHLDRERYEPIAIRIDRDGRWTLPDRPPTQVVAAEVIGQARLERSRAPRPVREREVHLAARPGEPTLLTVDWRGQNGAGTVDGQDGALVRGLALDVVFPVLHGPYGEDGTVQGLLELADVAYVGSGVLGSAVAMDKAVAKVLFAARGLRVSDHVVFTRREWAAGREALVERIAGQLGFPVFVKPPNLGSSVGISKVKARGGLAEAIDLAASFDRKILVEAAVPNAREIEVAVLGNDEPQASVPGEIVPSREFYDYEAKYLDEGSAARIPAPLDPALAAEIRRQAIEAYRAAECAGMARVDFLVDGRTGQVFVNEVNTIPGFTTISMYGKLWDATGLPYPALLDRLIALAMERFQEKQQLRTTLG